MEGCGYNETHVVLYKKEEIPLGKTWEDWTTKWWQWFLSIPKEKNPALDTTGENCDINQDESGVWFLAGTVGGRVERTCFVPDGKAVLLPIIGFATSYAENPDLKTEDDLIRNAKSNIDDIQNRQATINGFGLNDFDYCRILSPPFNVILPQENVCNAPLGHTTAVGDGYWIFVKSLDYHKCQIRVAGSCLSGKIQIGAVINLIIRDKARLAC
jgi:hypothetical protein